MASESRPVPRWSRRRLLGSLVAAPAALVGASRLARWPLRWLGRPAAAGTSTSRCGACGSPGHTMLDPSCPAAPRGLV